MFTAIFGIPSQIHKTLFVDNVETIVDLDADMKIPHFTIVLFIFPFLWEHVIPMIDISKWHLLWPSKEVNCSFLESTTTGLPLQSI